MLSPRRAFLLVTALACASGAAAQGPRADQARAVFTPDRSVRVQVDARRTEGRVATLGDSQVVLRRDVSVERIALADVDTVWAAKRAIGKGALIGALVGGVILGVFADTDTFGSCEAGCGYELALTLVGFGVGAAGGAALGAGLGALFRTWDRAWP